MTTLGNTPAAIRLSQDLAKGGELKPLQAFVRLAKAGFGTLRRWAVKGHPLGGYLDAVCVAGKYQTTEAAVRRLLRQAGAARKAIAGPPVVGDKAYRPEREAG